ncbi:MAG: hypothetical protein Q4F65_14640 [Propionibacteriaceae bacterium]|nr:hypothetical protein [Propionibacteriaceae bacterium]
MTYLSVLAVVGLLVVIGLIVVGLLVWQGSQRTRQTPQPGASDPQPQPQAQPSPTPRPAPTPAAPSIPAPPLRGETIDRDTLLGRERTFDPRGWDDRPDGFEGTDMGMVGSGDDGLPTGSGPSAQSGPSAPAGRAGEGVDAAFMDRLRARTEES